MSIHRVITVEGPEQAAELLCALTGSAQISADTISLATVVGRLQVAGYDAPTTCEILNAYRCLEFLVNSVQPFEHAVAHLASEHDVLPAAHMIELLSSFRLMCYRKIAAASEKANLPLVKGMNLDAMEENYSIATTLRERIEAKQKQVAEMVAAADIGM